MDSGDTLTCTDCFAIMDLFLLAAELGVDLTRQKVLTREFLAYCLGCREKLSLQL
jgi:hypothetical protein